MDTPRQRGFWAAYEVYIQGPSKSPGVFNPYKVHTYEREEFTKGYAEGKKLGAAQRTMAKRVAATLHGDLAKLNGIREGGSNEAE